MAALLRALARAALLPFHLAAAARPRPKFIERQSCKSTEYLGYTALGLEEDEIGLRLGLQDCLRRPLQQMRTGGARCSAASPSLPSAWVTRDLLARHTLRTLLPLQRAARGRQKPRPAPKSHGNPDFPIWGRSDGTRHPSRLLPL